MFSTVLSLVLLLNMCTAENFYYRPRNITRSTPSGIAAYRSALTLDYLAAEDHRQRELVAAYETETPPSHKGLMTDCMTFPRPGTGKVARLMLELLKNLEGDNGQVIPELIQALIRSKLLVLETAIFESEPDFDALVETPNMMMGEPHTTFPRILAMIWMTVTDPSTRKHGWCAVNKVTKYLGLAKPSDIAKTMRALDPVVSRARYIMEEFIQQVTPLNMLQRSTTTTKKITFMKTHSRSKPPKEQKNRVQAHSQSQNYPYLPHGSHDGHAVTISEPTSPAQHQLVAASKLVNMTSTTTKTTNSRYDRFNEDEYLLSAFDSGNFVQFNEWLSFILVVPLLLV